MVVALMDIGKFFVSVIFFVFVVFLFPTLNEACTNATTADMAPVIQAFPYIFLVVACVFPVYFLLKGVVT